MNRVCSIFSQLLQLFSRAEFERAVKDHKAERARARLCELVPVGSHAVSASLGRAHSLREICGGLACCEGKLKHLGISLAPKRSTLAYANEHRPWELFRTVFTQLLGKCQELVAAQGGRKKFRFQEQADEPGRQRDRPVGVVVRLGQVPPHQRGDQTTPAAGPRRLPASFAVVTDGKHSELKVARTLHFEPGTILAIDRGYIDYDWFAELTRQEVYFVTRMKENAVYQVKAEFAVPQTGTCSRTN